MFCVDSRKVVPGSTFIAMKGNKSDGHLFLGEAARKGATHAIVSVDYLGEGFGMDLRRVADPLAELQRLAKEKLKRSRTKVIAITGSVGKTTTKEFVATLLSERFHLAKTLGSANSQVALPLTLLNDFQGDEELIVLEMGMSEKGQIKKLTEIAPPTVAVLTAINYAHSQFFDSLEAIAEAKAEIFVPSCSKAFAPEELFSFAVVAGKGVEPVAIGELQGFSPPFREAHLLMNLALAVRVARSFGLHDQEIAHGIAKLKRLNGRGNRVEKEGITFIDDSYNASPASVKAALNALEGKRRVAVLGSMLELGSFSEALHLEVGELALEKVDLLFLLGEETLPIQQLFSKKGRQCYHFKELSHLKIALKKALQTGDVVLVKGSNSLKMGGLIETV